MQSFTVLELNTDTAGATK